MTDKPYEIPDPKKEPIKCLVLAYKVTKGVPHDDRFWDSVHWARTSKSAKSLFEICGGLRQADACLLDMAKRFNEKELAWTIETVVKHAHDWIAKKRGPLDANANAYRARFFKAMSERVRSEDGDGKSETTESLPDSLRMFEDSQEGHKKDDQ